MNYNEALSYIHGSVKFGKKIGLHNIEVLLDLMDNPQKKLRFVHVAGTNGKGSTSAFIAGILTEAGYKTGMYTSPYIQRFNERIRIGSEEISRHDLAGITAFVKGKVDEMLGMSENHPTEFEIITAIAFEYYYRKGCDVVVLEVGLGGRFDPTNIIDVPMAAVIANIGYDHTERLGTTLPQIAFEKAGIIKPGGDVVIYDQSREVEQVFEAACAERGARLHRVDFSGIVRHEFDISGQAFDYGGYDGLKTSLLGRHQTYNAALAVKTVEILDKNGFRIPGDSIRRGIANTKWPGRLEVLSKNPVFIIDGAHNPQGAAMLRNTLDEYFPGKPMTFIIGVLSSKDYAGMLQAALPGCSRVFAVTADSAKALPAAELAKAAQYYCKNTHVSDTIESAVRTCLDTAEQDGVICAFGSLYYIGAVRDLFGL